MEKTSQRINKIKEINSQNELLGIDKKRPEFIFDIPIYRGFAQVVKKVVRFSDGAVESYDHRFDVIFAKIHFIGD